MTSNERTQVKIALIGLPIFLAALMGPGTIDRILSHLGL
jgi:hypothetical protein